MFEKVPSFDAELGPGALGLYDDTLFSFQLKKAGFKIGHAFDVISEHHFDESRLLRKNLISHGKKKGRSLAYLRHHWFHRQMDFSAIKYLKSQLSLAKLRLMGAEDSKDSEGISDRELTVVSHTQLYRQYFIESSRQRNYSQEGLVKIS